MEIKEVANKDQWEEFVSRQKPTSILQSWKWSSVDEAEKRVSAGLFVTENGGIVAACRISKINILKDYHYIYSPRGPVFKSGIDNKKKEKIISELGLYVKSKYPDALFFRIDPELLSGGFVFNSSAFRKTGRELQPKQTIVLRLDGSEEEIFDKMKPKARYNVRLAEKKGVKVHQAENEDDVVRFFETLRETEGRHGFRVHPKEHYLNLWRALRPGNLEIYLAKVNENVAAGIMVTFYGDTATYLHGGSRYEYRSYMAPHLLHWHAIKEAKKRGIEFYDFWGVAPKGAHARHPWSGITRFKESFGGEFREYIGAHDYVYRAQFYSLFTVVKKIRQAIKKMKKA